MASKRTGRPPRYENREEVEGLIDKYFEDCEGELLKDHNGDPMLDKWGHPVYVGKRPPTATGLALALGFNSRTSLFNYKAKAEFRDTITRAMSRIEQYTEERLFDRDGANGAKFSLQNNFKGWREDKAAEDKSPAVNIICDIPKAVQAEKAAEEKGEGGTDAAG